MSQKIRIKLKSYDYNLVDKSAEKIVKTVKTTGAVVTGPIPLPTHKKLFTVLRSPHVNKKAREQFEVMSYKRLIDIYSSSSKTIKADVPLSEMFGYVTTLRTLSSGRATSTMEFSHYAEVPKSLSEEVIAKVKGRSAEKV